MGTYIDTTSVRRTCGIAATEISDVDVESTITEIEAQVPRFFNTQFVPTEEIEIMDGDGTNRALLGHNPILSVRELRIDETEQDTAELEVNKESGYIFLGQGATTSVFAAKRNTVVVKYIYGTVEHSSTKTTSSDAEVSGTNVSVAVASETGFEADDWVEIFGMDGKREAAQVISTSTGILLLDELVLTHEADSTIVKLQVNANFTKLMNLIASIALVARIVGQSYTDTVGYNLGELHVQKGEPYTQWRETANQFIKERNSLMARIGIRPYIL